MQRRHRAGRQEFQREVAVGHGIHGISRRPVEAERGGGHLPVDGKRRAGERRRAQRRFVQAAPGVGEAPPVAAQHLDIGEHVVAEGDRLAVLQMGEARHG